MTVVRLLRAALAAWLIAPLATGCASLYFDDAGPPPDSAQHELARWPYQDYWHGIVFNGAKIGFSHVRLAPAANAPGLYEIESRATFTLRFLGLEKRFQLASRDVVHADLTLVRFTTDTVMDGNERQVTGAYNGRVLSTTVTDRDQLTEQSFDVAGPLYPASVLHLYPTLHGLKLGRQHRYTVYDSELQQLASVEQDVEAYERSELFEGSAFRIATRMRGHSTTTWINTQGLPVFELALNGVLIAALENEESAKRYLVAASLSKQDVLLDFSLVRLDRPIADPLTRDALTVIVSGLDANNMPPPELRQRCRSAADNIVCELRRITPDANARATSMTESRYLEPSSVAPSVHPRIKQLAESIAANTGSPLAQVERIVAWIKHNVAKEPVDVFSALDVLDGKKAECQGHTYLYTALARSRGIPTRVVNGLTYSPEHQGFLYHTWAESWLGGQWLAIDPTFAQIGVDATHIKLLEAETPAELLPLVEVVGRLKLRVID